MPKRIIGVETEFGAVGRKSDGTIIDSEILGKAIFHPVKKRFGTYDTFIENGGRLYLDVGNHPEFSTPECLDGKDIVAYDRAGSSIILGLAKKAQKKLTDYYQQEVNIDLWRNNVDSAGNSWGYHENYSIRRDSDIDTIVRLLIPFLVSRQIIGGAGSIAQGSDGKKRYLLSQRSLHITKDCSSDTTQFRPYINNRDESHANPSKWRRLHVIGGDTLMNQYQTWLILSITSLVLDVIESGAIWREWPIENISQALEEMAKDLSGRSRVPLANGRAASALDIQWAYAERVHQWIEAGNATAKNRHIHEQWINILEGLERDPMTLADRLDWVSKYQLLLQYKSRHNLKFTDPALQFLDYQYHNCDPAKGLFWILENNSQVMTLLETEDIENALIRAPQDTRAKLRGEFISAAIESKTSWSASWSGIKAMGINLDIVDPFQTIDERVEKLISKLPTRDYT